MTVVFFENWKCFEIIIAWAVLFKTHLRKGNNNLFFQTVRTGEWDLHCLVLFSAYTFLVDSMNKHRMYTNCLCVYLHTANPLILPYSRHHTPSPKSWRLPRLQSQEDAYSHNLDKIAQPKWTPWTPLASQVSKPGGCTTTSHVTSWHHAVCLGHVKALYTSAAPPLVAPFSYVFTIYAI